MLTMTLLETKQNVKAAGPSKRTSAHSRPENRGLSSRGLTGPKVCKTGGVQIKETAYPCVCTGMYRKDGDAQIRLKTPIR